MTACEISFSSKILPPKTQSFLLHYHSKMLKKCQWQEDRDWQQFGFYLNWR